MRKVLSYVMVTALMLTMIPTAYAAGTEFDFIDNVTYDLPTVTNGNLIIEQDDFPSIDEFDFLQEPSDELPAIQADGFLAKPTAPLKSFPKEGTLLTDITAERFEPEIEGYTAISSAKELAEMATGGQYYLTCDIELSNESWEPISLAEITLDGRGHKITGLTLDGTVITGNLGLFAYVKNLTVRNLLFDDVSIVSGTSLVGVLVGYASTATIENCSVESLSIVRGAATTGYIGGFIGLLGQSTRDCGTFTDCVVTGTVNLSPLEGQTCTFSNVGGLVGRCEGATVTFTDCLSGMDLICGDAAQVALTHSGGILGYYTTSSRTDTNLTLLRCVASGKLEGNAAYLGGLVGGAKLSAAEITDCLFNGSLTGSAYACGGIISELDAFEDSSVAFDNCRSEGAINSTAISGYIGGIAAKGPGTYYTFAYTFTNCLSDCDITSGASRGKTYLGGLMGLATNGTTARRCLSTCSISLSETPNSLIYTGGMFGRAGSFEADTCALYQCENRGDIVGGYVGGMVGYGSPQLLLEDCKNTGDISTKYVMEGISNPHTYAGGLVGYSLGSAENCISRAAVSGGYIGGLVGYSTELSMDHCLALGDIMITGDLSGMNETGVAGGIAGYGKPNLTDCAADVTISSDVTTAPLQVGGMVGNAAQTGRMDRCVADVTFSREDGLYWLQLGGMAGVIDGQQAYSNCFAVVTVQDLSYYSTEYSNDRALAFGGMVGHMKNNTTTLNLTNCGAEVDIELSVEDGTVFAGGLVGYAYGTASLRNCYAVGNINMLTLTQYASGWLGGLVSYACNDLTIGQCYAGVDLTAQSEENFAHGVAMGGLVAYIGGAATVYSAWSDADLCSMEGKTGRASDIDYQAYYLAGLLGCVEEALYMQDCCFLGEVSDANCRYTGGLAGKTGSAKVHNCYTELVLDASSISVAECTALGGIVAYTGAVDMEYCHFSGKLYGTNFTSTGGIAASVNSGTISDCSASGAVWGKNAGGIAGSAGSVVISDCTSRCAVQPCLNCNGTHGHNLGGIVGSISSGTVSNCHMEIPLVSASAFSEYHSLNDIYIGGITGKAYGNTVVISDCTSLGISAAFTNPNVVYVGGICGNSSAPYSAGSYQKYPLFQRCKVDGDVKATVTSANQKTYLYVGGLIGGSSASCKGCAVIGDVSAYRDPNPNSMRNYVGGIMGASELEYDTSYHLGKIKYRPANYTHHNTPLLGYGTLINTNVDNVEIPERPTENYMVNVMGFHDGDILSMAPLQGATVTVDGTIVGTSGTNGKVSFDSTKVSATGMAVVCASMDGYFQSDTFTYLADGGSITLVLMKKTPGKIYLKSASLIVGDTVTEVLSGVNTAWLSQNDETPRAVRPSVDWNNIDEEGRIIRLVNEDGSASVQLTDDDITYVDFVGIFDVDEAIYLEAKGTYEGQEVTSKILTTIRIKPIDFTLRPKAGVMQVGPTKDDPESDEGETPKYLYFLDNLGVDLKFEDLEKYAGTGGIVYKNGILTVEIGGKTEDNQQFSTWNTRKESVSCTGKLSIPILDLENGEWSGSVQAVINSEDKTDKSATAANKWNEALDDDDEGLSVTHQLIICGVPCFVEVTVSVGGSATLGVHGTLENPCIDGAIAILGSGDFFGGVGGQVGKKVELKFGPYGKIEVELPAKLELYENLKGDLDARMHLDPTFDGSLGARASIKAFIVDLALEMQLGKFHWDEESGGVWSGKQAIEPTLLAEDLLDGAIWLPADREYLKAGGGFHADSINLMEFHSALDDAVRYENISSLSESALTTENGKAVLYYTADDGSSGTDGNQAEHTLLYRTVRNSNGSWSEPSAISAEGNYPVSPAADGTFVTWVESTKTDSLDNMLSSTVIKVAQTNGKTHVFDLGSYVYEPQISVSADGSSAMLSWMNDPQVTSENLNGATPSVYYAKFADGVWSEPMKLRTGPISAKPVCTENIVYFTYADGSLYKSSSYSALTTNVSQYACNSIIQAYMTDTGVLNINRSSYSNTASFSTGYTGMGDLKLVTDGTQYVLCWPEKDGIYYSSLQYNNVWSEPALLEVIDGFPEAFDVTFVEGTLMVSYMLTQDDDDGSYQTDLYTVIPRAKGIDLILQKVHYDAKEVSESGRLTMDGLLFNNGQTAINGYSLVVKDETGKTVYSTKATEDYIASNYFREFMFSFYPDGLSAHTYTVTVTPYVTNNAALTIAEDVNPSDNQLSIELDYSNAEIVDAGFLLVGTDVQLQAMVRNSGAYALSDLIVEVAAGGTVVANHSFTENGATVPSGSIRQLLLNDPIPNTYYQVNVYSQGELMDSTMLLYEDPDAQTLSLISVTMVEDLAKVTLHGVNQSEENMDLLLALYTENGQMVACSSTTISEVNGTQKLSFKFSDMPVPGTYDYKLFGLSGDGTYSPLYQPFSGKLQIQ